MATQLNELEQDAKKVTDATTQVWSSIVQDKQLEKLIAQLQEAYEKLETLKMSLK